MPILNDAENLNFGGEQVLRVNHRGVGVWVLPVPVNSFAPVVSGGTTAPADLSCSTGTWTNTPSGYTYQWQEDISSVWTDMVGETANTLDDAPAGTYRCMVTASNSYGSGVATASNSLIVTSGGTGFFGIQTVGENGYPTSDNRYIAARFYLDRTATITEIVTYTVGSGGNLRGVIWNDVAGEPGSVAVVGEPVAPATDSWRTSVVSGGGVTLTSGWYYIGVVTSGYYSSLRHNLLAGNAMRANNGGNYAAPGAWPGSGDYTYVSQLSVYANYTY